MIDLDTGPVAIGSRDGLWCLSPRLFRTSTGLAEGSDAGTPDLGTPDIGEIPHINSVLLALSFARQFLWQSPVKSSYFPLLIGLPDNGNVSFRTN